MAIIPNRPPVKFPLSAHSVLNTKDTAFMRNGQNIRHFLFCFHFHTSLNFPKSIVKKLFQHYERDIFIFLHITVKTRNGQDAQSFSNRCQGKFFLSQQRRYLLKNKLVNPANSRPTIHFFVYLRQVMRNYTKPENIKVKFPVSDVLTITAALSISVITKPYVPSTSKDFPLRT